MKPLEPLEPFLKWIFKMASIKVRKKGLESKSGSNCMKKYKGYLVGFQREINLSESDRDCMAYELS